MLFDKNIDSYDEMVVPKDLISELPLTDVARENVDRMKDAVQKILNGDDSRTILIVGPCSIHDISAAKEYLLKLKELSDSVEDKFLILMRTYFEKPRSTVGWKGLIFDPKLNDTFDMAHGIRIAREFLVYANNLGVGVATEFLDPITPQYISDCISWAAIGARTIESQTHRQMVSGLSMPVGLKNATNGSVDIAIDAVVSSNSPHSFLGVNSSGVISKVNTNGNLFSHIVLRGGSAGPNYSKECIDMCTAKLKSKGLLHKVIVDCSHANSNKDFKNQAKVFSDVMARISSENRCVVGLMLESNPSLTVS